MNVKIIVIALFAVVTLLQIYQCKPTHRFVRETNDEDEGRTKKIKEFLSQFYGGSTTQSQQSSTQSGSSSPYQPQSSTSNQPGSSTPYQPGSSNYPDPSTSPLVETPAGPESY
ncbi:uncharacterized protein LOC100570068 [Acyrthosiphon pisum]|uniref:Uncharacterized protein n=1 Tax=Acyrthosiphon pisum TaxID=7029 RepID=A0A8R2A7C4_ACYPI|nr:uncharacterized protein LOC100570068 [Acyrthosiphon pisum]|eukprot:XP_003243708.1 PREDICTED: uncharacterized protein LOC100570068 [Acyrthosiphon pisum]